ncbi:MAG: hypothetical protein LC685_01200 [Actinobacteria bacterium]|nr:hypothetical protein [Actinomycetota bacterium]
MGDMWPETPRHLEGRTVVLERLTVDHAEPLWEAAASDPLIWDWMTIRAGDNRELFQAWLDHIAGEERAGRLAPYATLVHSGRSVTRAT